MFPTLVLCFVLTVNTGTHVRYSIVPTRVPFTSVFLATIFETFLRLKLNPETSHILLSSINPIFVAPRITPSKPLNRIPPNKIISLGRHSVNSETHLFRSQTV